MGDEPKRPDKPQYGALPTDVTVRLHELNLEAGWLGKILGTSKNAPINIAGVTLFALLLLGLVVAWKKGFTEGIDFWKWSGPLMALILGYVLGRK